jgi:starch phosphorylase
MARRQPCQVVFAGKAHPRDDGGKELIARLHSDIQRLRGAIPMAFLQTTTSRWLAAWCPVPMYG